jgi:vacuolar-type H+-ATPase catalytic subunit A/Vma1
MKAGNPSEVTDDREGKVIRIAGPVVGASGLDEVRLFDVVR